MITIVWFRQDLRISDNPALFHAARKGQILPVYILDESKSRPLGSASRWWLHHSLTALEKSLGRLVFLRGDPLQCLQRLNKAVGAAAIYWNRCYEPESIARDSEIKFVFSDTGVEVRSFNANLLNEPWEVKTGSGDPFKVYSSFWRAARAVPNQDLLPSQEARIYLHSVDGEELNDWRLLPGNPDWATGWNKLWRPGEDGARQQLEAFVDSGLKGYAKLRDRPDMPNVSHLSPHLHFGEISPRQVWARVQFAATASTAIERHADKFLSEIGWREFSYHLLYHFPGLPKKNLRPAFDRYPWEQNSTSFDAWKRGQTGYPLVDAGMRELWNTGYMHNRVRMVTASFLVKHLRIHWRQGEAWFWDTLVDADMANNAASWQWVTGSGADAAPYFRIFNPTTQARKFDPEGTYIRKWCPELARLPNNLIHAPFEATEERLRWAGIELGRSYPKPIVDHVEARIRALQGFDLTKDVFAKSRGMKTTDCS